jgi:hypothetical protein
MRNWVKTSLFVSAFSPCLISIALARIWDGGLTWEAAYYGIAGLLGILVVRYVLDAIRWNSEIFPFSAKKVESNDQLMLGVVATYFVPFIGKAAEINVGIILLIIAAALMIFWMSSSILLSPVMRLLSYRFYKAEGENGVVYTLLTRREILDSKDVKRVRKITDSMLVEVFGDESFRSHP